MTTQREYAPEMGNVIVVLDGEEFILRPTLEAALALSRQAGGIRAAITKVIDLDLDVITSVIRLGVGRDAAKKLKNLDRMIWEQGLLDAQGELALRCVEFLSNLARGGRPEAPDGAAAEDAARPTMKPSPSAN